MKTWKKKSPAFAHGQGTLVTETRPSSDHKKENRTKQNLASYVFAAKKEIVILSYKPTTL